MPDQAKNSSSTRRRFIEKYFSPQIDLRVRLFNVLAMFGATMSAFMGISVLITGTRTPVALLDFFGSLVAIGLLYYSQRTGRYQQCYMLTIVAIFLLLFSFVFFKGNGYNGSMTSFFIFAVVFTAFMLDGKKMFVMVGLELFIYSGMCVYVLFHPESIQPFANETVRAINIITGFVVVSLFLGISMFQQFRLYNEQQRKLDEQNAVLAQANRMKSEFLANASHEMRTPLTVTSVNVQTVMEILEDMGEAVDDPEAIKLLQSAQDEIMRLSRMVGGMLTLASMSENTDRQRLDLTSLLHSGIEMLRLNLERRGNTLEANIESELSVFGNADLLAQVLSNILQNAGAHTKNGKITISANKQGNEIVVGVRDTGTGISPEILSHVFERGVSTGSTGYGLYLCKTVVESHGGRICALSEPGSGTAVSYTLPYYEGQFGGAEQL